MIEQLLYSRPSSHMMANRFGQTSTFDSDEYKRRHQARLDMSTDVLGLFTPIEVAWAKALKKPKCRPLDPVSTLVNINMVSMFQQPHIYAGEQEQIVVVKKIPVKVIKKDQKQEIHQKHIREDMAEWNPFTDCKITSDPERTLVVARLNYSTTETSLQHQFERYGIIRSVRIVRDLQDKSRGYGFVQFDSKNDFISAYKQANLRTIQGRKVIVDYQKGRTLLRWKPRRFGGGAGTLRMTTNQIIEMDKQQQARKNLRKDKKEQSRDVRERSRSKDRKKDKERSRDRDRERDHRDKDKDKDRERDREHKDRDHKDKDHKEKKNKDKKKDKE